MWVWVSVMIWGFNGFNIIIENIIKCHQYNTTQLDENKLWVHFYYRSLCLLTLLLSLNALLDYHPSSIMKPNRNLMVNLIVRVYLITTSRMVNLITRDYLPFSRVINPLFPFWGWRMNGQHKLYRRNFSLS